MKRISQILAIALIAISSFAQRTGGGGGGGGTGTAGSTLFSSTTQAGPSNTLTETSVIGTVTGSLTIPANTFLNGGVLQVVGEGFYSLPATADSLQATVYCGATILGRATFVPPAGVITNGTWTLSIAITAIGSGGSGALATNGSIDLHTTGPGLIASGKILNTSNVSFDFTTSCAFDMKMKWNAAQVGESITGTNVTAYIPGAPVSSVFGQKGAVANLAGAVTTSGTTTTSPGVVDVLTSSEFCQAAGASGTAYTCNLSPAITGYVTGTHYRFKADVANTAAASINFNAQGAKTIKKAVGGITTDLVANDLRAGQWVDLVYDGTNMQVQSTLGNSASGAGTVSANSTSNLHAVAVYNSNGGSTTVQADTGASSDGAGNLTVASVTTTGSSPDVFGPLPDPSVSTVAGLPGSPSNGQLGIVTDGSSASDCTVGSGSNKNLCKFNGSIWVFMQAATGSTWLSSTTAGKFKLYDGTSIKTIGPAVAICAAGLGDGLNAIPAGTYVITNCYNDFGQTYTITAVRCFTDNSGTSTLNAANDGATGLLTGAITCANTFVAGTQSGTTTIAANHWINFTFVADGTTKRLSVEVSSTK